MDRLMWTATTRTQHRCEGLRFASDVTDAEWALIESASRCVSVCWVVERCFAWLGRNVASPRISRQQSLPQQSSSMPYQPCSCSGASLVAHEVRVSLQG